MSLVCIIVVRLVEITAYFFMVFDHFFFEDTCCSLEVISVSKNTIYNELDNFIFAVFVQVLAIYTFLVFYQIYHLPSSFTINSIRSELKIDDRFYWRWQISSN